MEQLTKKQLEELRRVAKEPQPSYGSARVRTQHTLERKGLVFISSDGFRCHLTIGGQELLAELDRG